MPEGQLSTFVNNQLLGHSHAHLFTYCLKLLSSANGRAEWVGQRPYGLKA